MPVSKSYEAYINVTDIPEGKSMSKYRNVYVDVNDFINDNYTQSLKHTWSSKKINEAIPKSLSALSNDAGYLTEEEATEITENYFQTIAVNYYLKSEVYTKEEFDEILDKYYNMNLLKVDELPEVGSADTIYLVTKTEDAGENNELDEYLWINDKWEYVGGVVAIDITNIYTKAEADAIIDSIVDDTKISEDTTWSSSKVLSYIDDLLASIDGNKELY